MYGVTQRELNLGKPRMRTIKLSRGFAERQRAEINAELGELWMKQAQRAVLQPVARLAQPYRNPVRASEGKARPAFRWDSIHSLAENASSRRHWHHPTCPSAHPCTNRKPPARFEFL